MKQMLTIQIGQDGVLCDTKFNLIVQDVYGCIHAI